MLAHLVALTLVQALEPEPATPFNRVFAIEIAATDPVLDAHGPAKRVEYEARFSGTLHVWTKSARDLDLFLRLEDDGGAFVAEDDNSGGGNAPYVKLAVEPGRKLWIHAARLSGSADTRAAALEIHCAAAPESQSTRDAARAAERALTEIKKLRAKQDLAAARALTQETIDELVAAPGARESELIARAAWYLGEEAHNLSDLAAARQAFGATLSHRSLTVPETHPGLLNARQNFAVVIGALGDLAGERALEEQVLEIRSRILPDDHPDLQSARRNLAGTILDLGDFAGARALDEQVLETYSRTLPADHLEVQKARLDLAIVIGSMGDFATERALEERVLEVFSRTLPEDHHDFLNAQMNLAATIETLGDLPRARVLQERVLEVRSRTLPEDHPDLLKARQNLAVTLKALHDYADARELEERVLEVRSRTLPEDHPSLQEARRNLGRTLRALGDLVAARELLERALEVRARTLPADHPVVQRARLDLAEMDADLGDLTGALALEESVLEVFTRTRPEAHPDLQWARKNVAVTLAAHVARSLHSDAAGGTGETDRAAWIERCAQLIGDLCRSETRAVRSLIAASPAREAEELCARRASDLSLCVSGAQGFGVFEPVRALEQDAFVLSETTRGAAILSSALTRKAEGSPKYSELRAALRDASDELAAVVRKGTASDEFDRARTKRESVERELVELARGLSGGKESGVELDVDSLAARLGERAAAVGFRRFRKWRPMVLTELDATGRPTVTGTPVESLCAFVVLGRADRSTRQTEGHGTERESEPSSDLTLIDLGSLAPIAATVQAWRDGQGIIDDTRGMSADAIANDAVDVRTRGAELRALIFDPLLPALANSERVVVALDDVLHVVPLDALPLDDGTLVGDRWRIQTRATLSELLQAREPAADSGSLVAFGDVDYEERTSSDQSGDLALVAAASSTAARRAEDAGILRGSAWSNGFSSLPATGAEVRGIARCFSQQFGAGTERAAHVLEQGRASREALFELAPKARFLHIATHGWFAPESIQSWSDPEPLDKQSGLGSRASGVEQVKGMGPMLLCGLALAGASRPENEIGRIPGLVTAEELSTLDLSNCALAVLSACDTNVGERRAGQGVASLQKALQMAGARSVITSLWKVPDEATKELMLDFYGRLWVEKKPKWQALWEAKRMMRDAKDERGQPKYTTRDWAAWVLTGDPN